MDEGRAAKKSRSTNSVASFLERHKCNPNGFVIVDYDRVWVTLGAKGHNITCNRETHESPLLLAHAISLLDDKVTAEVYGVDILKLVADPFPTPLLGDILKYHLLDDVANLLLTYDQEHITIHFGKTHVEMDADKCVLVTKCGKIEWDEMKRRAVDVIRYPGTVIGHENVIYNYVDTKANIIAEAIEAEAVEKAINDFLKRHDAQEVVFKYPNDFQVSVKKEDVVASHNGDECHMPLLVDHTISLFFNAELLVNAGTCTISKVPEDVKKACKALGILVKYTSADREEIIEALIDHDDFAVDNTNITIRHKDDRAQTDFEATWAEHLNIARRVLEANYTGYASKHDGQMHPHVTELPSTPFFTIAYHHLDVDYYFWRFVRNDREYILVSGVPNRLLYSIALYYIEDRKCLYISDFFTKHDDKSQFDAQRYIKRGLFIIKHIALLLKAKFVLVKRSLSVAAALTGWRTKDDATGEAYLWQKAVNIDIDAWSSST